ncbi:hypothetical protein PIB30_054617 [Stylosanthes scabra]|uniref:Uncharacterized protein n=1 Tax=Stylosanthes scabra TaxID=79078 RepID=A0ABU6SKI0_9FABA|nr:hypothetical protein [Stylosanthes scabra]
MDPSMDFIATVSESRFGQVAGRYQRARATAAAVEHLAPVRPPPPSHAALQHSIHGERHLRGSTL